MTALYDLLGYRAAVTVSVRVIAQAACYRFELGSPEASAALIEALCTGWRSRPLEAIA